ncbi:MAG TPA: saccharopine dehydrogenase NADP-binding domain-containing protein [Steroidobacteraceae bacterium]|nr:saccharopine dehydrogenase NADP-binding domain-containing protein [Steroidobacteraceae bacterium]
MTDPSHDEKRGRWLLYGANGYTGELIAREAVRRGMKPILAGRSAEKIATLAKELGCEHRAFTIEDQTATLVALQDASAVLNCAGPFSSTAGRMMQACLALHIHYIDITGEIDVFELAHSLHEKAQRARIVLCPGVGFDVVPTDCVAAKLHEALPDATYLALAFESSSRMSIGTAKTSIENAGRGGRVRKDGAIIDVSLGYKERRIDFGDGPRETVTIPWGDVSTAYFTTHIPNIEVYVAGLPGIAKQMRQLNKLRWLIRRGIVKWLVKRSFARRGPGPDQTERECNPTNVWGEVVNATGKKKVAHLRTANAYVVTIHSSLAILSTLLERQVESGYTTPAKLMGARFIETLPGSSAIRISDT